MLSRSLQKSGRRARPSVVALLGALLVLGCNYGFRGGGGFPPEIRTIYIEPFENRTIEFELQEQLYNELLEQLPRRLGVRLAGRETADAIVRGRITGYDDAAQNYRAGDPGQAPDVLANRVQVTIGVEVVDTRRNVVLWESSALTGQGEYSPTSESPVDGRKTAIERLVLLLIDGAQSQW